MQQQCANLHCNRGQHRRAVTVHSERCFRIALSPVHRRIGRTVDNRANPSIPANTLHRQRIGNVEFRQIHEKPLLPAMHFLQFLQFGTKLPTAPGDKNIHCSLVGISGSKNMLRVQHNTFNLVQHRMMKILIRKPYLAFRHAPFYANGRIVPPDARIV